MYSMNLCSDILTYYVFYMFLYNILCEGSIYEALPHECLTQKLTMIFEVECVSQRMKISDTHLLDALMNTS